MDLRMEVYTPDLVLVGLLQVHRSMRWEEKAFSAGSFTIESLITGETRMLLVPENIVLFTEDTAGIIEHVTRTADEEGPYITARGRLLSGILDRRILWGLYELNDVPEKLMRDLVLDCCIEPTRGEPEQRKIPGLFLDESPLENAEKIRRQKTGGSLSEFLEELAETYQIAYGIRFNPRLQRMEFWTRPGKDRTVTQTENEPVFYSTELDDVLESEYIFDSSNYKNVSYVAGEGDGINRTTVIVADESGYLPEPTKYRILLAVDPQGGGYVSGGGPIPQGTSLTVTATPMPKYLFAGWSENGEIISTNPSYTFTVESDRRLTAKFALKCVISASADPEGSGLISGTGIYKQGERVALSIHSSNGYAFVKWQENGVTVSESNPYTFIAESDRTFVAVSEMALTIDASAGTGGSIQPSGQIVVKRGDNQRFEIMPQENYNISDVTADGNSVGAVPDYTFENIQESHVIHAEFVAQFHTVSVSAQPETGGTVTGGGTYAHGEKVTVTAHPADSYKFSGWTENGNVVSTNAAYTFTLTADRTLAAVYEDDITITASAGDGGTIVPSGTLHIERGASQAFDIVAKTEEGRWIYKVEVDGEDVGGVERYTFDNVQKSHIIHAQFGVENYSINLSANVESGGTLNGTGAYRHGTSVTVSATENSGYKFVCWTENGTQVSASLSYTFTAVRPRNLVAVYDIIITASAGDGGSISPSGQVRVAYGADQAFTITPDSGYKIAGVIADGFDAGAVPRFTYENVQTPKTIRAEFVTDSIQWTKAALPSTANWAGITYGNGRFVAIASRSKKAAYSTNGTNWIASTTLPSSTDWNIIAYGDGKFVAMVFNGNTASYSTNGTSWTAVTLPSTGYWNDMVYGGDKFVAVSTTGRIAYSTGGVSWKSKLIASTLQLASITYGNGRFVAIATGNQAAYSDDGINWATVTLPETANWNSIAYGNGWFVALSDSGMIIRSSNGAVWTDVSYPLPAFSGSYGVWNHIVFGNKKFVVTSSNSTRSAYSEDGVSWKTNLVLPQYGVCGGMAYGNGRFAAVYYDSANAAYLDEGSL